MPIMDHIEEQPMLSLESQLTALAIESDFTVNFTELFKSTLPNFLSNLINVRQNIDQTKVSQQDIVYKLTSKEKEALKIAEHLTFLTFGERMISTPENFSGKFLDYAKVLSVITADAYKVQVETLSEYNLILSSFLTNKDDKISLKDHTSFFNRIKNEREKFTQELAHYHSKGNGKSYAKLNTLMDRMSDLEFIIKASKDLSSQNEAKRLQELKDSVNHSVDLLNMIIDNVKSGKVTNISSNAAMNIAQGAYEVAKYVEFVSVVYFDVMVFLTSVDRLLSTIIDTAQK